jgi:hypothetical protein
MMHPYSPSPRWLTVPGIEINARPQVDRQQQSLKLTRQGPEQWRAPAR